MQADRKILFAQKHEQHEQAGSELRENRCGGSPCNVHAEGEHEDRVEDNIQSSSDQRCGHAQYRKSLSGNKVVHACREQGEKSSAGVDGQISIGIGKNGPGWRRTRSAADFLTAEKAE